MSKQKTTDTTEEWKLNLRDEDNYVMDNVAYATIHKTWKLTLKSFIKNNQKILIINGADQIAKSAMISSADVTICDPNAYTLLENESAKENLQLEDFKNEVDSLGYEHKLYLLDMTFKEAIEDECFKDKFDVIIVANSYTEDLSDVTSKEFLEYCYFFLKDRGLLLFQIDKSAYNSATSTTFKLCLDYYFSELNKKLKHFPSIDKTFAFSSYVKFSNSTR